MCMHAQSLQLCSTLCDPVDCCPPGFSVQGILQARILEWAATPSSRRSLPNPGIEPASLMSPASAGGFLVTSATWEAPSSILYTKSFKLDDLCRRSYIICNFVCFPHN